MAKVNSDWIKRKQEILATQSQEGKTFHHLYENLGNVEFMRCALENVLNNQEAQLASIDGFTKEDLKAHKKREELVYGLVADMRRKTYRPQPIRRVSIGQGNLSQISTEIATIRDRVVQEAIYLLLDPIYESRFNKHSYGYRLYRTPQYSAMRAKDLMGRHGYLYGVKVSVQSCLDDIDPVLLLKILRQTIKDEPLLKVIRMISKAGGLNFSQLHMTEADTHLESDLLPLLANVYLNELDSFIDGFWATLAVKYRERYKAGKYEQACPCFIVRYAGHLLVLTKTRQDAERMQQEVTAFLQTTLKFKLLPEATSLVTAGEGFDFLTFNIRKWDSRTLIKPSKSAINKFKETARERIKIAFSLDDVAAIAYINQYVIGWAMYYRSISSSQAFRYLDHYLWHRVYKTSKRMRGSNKVTRRGHYLKHYLPYRCDIKASNRRYKGRNYGVWLDEQRTQALILVRLGFVKIKYNPFHPQLNPYIEREKQILEKMVDVRHLPSNRLSILLRSLYGVEWRVLRQIVLKLAHHRCQQCHCAISGRTAHVHHVRPRHKHKSRTQANKYQNLMAVCPRCHASLEAGLGYI